MLLLPTRPVFRGLPRPSPDLPAAGSGCAATAIPSPGEGLEEGALYRVYGQDGTFLCLSRCQRGMLVSVKNFFGG